jgi:hypothetical protein
MLANGDGKCGRNAWLVAAAFVAVFGLGWAGGANWHRFSNIEAASNPATQKVTYLRRIPDSETKSAAKTDGLVRKTTSTTGSLGTLVAASSRTASVVQTNTNLPGVLAVPRETMGPVPETRRIDSIVRWGNRWIVATANGLIATP